MAGTTLGKRSRSEVELPSTPTKRRVIAQRPLTPRTTPTKSTGVCTPRSGTKSRVTPYSPTRSALRRSAEAGVVGRDIECSRLRDFVESDTEHLLYICGPPGTGKSATTAQFLATDPSVGRTKRRIVQVNCVALGRPEQVASTILRQLDAPGSTLRDLKSYLAACEPTVLVLDEIDYLLSGCSEVLYAVFELHRLAGVKVIGIANALNLTDSLLPHLRAAGVEPSVLSFRPYTPAELTAILRARVPAGVVDAPALVLLGRKVANATGDVRRALDILRSAVELVEQEYRAGAALSPVAGNGELIDRKLHTVTVAHIARVSAVALGGAAHAARATSATIAMPPTPRSDDGKDKSKSNDDEEAPKPARAVTSMSQLIEQTLSIHEKAALCTMISRKAVLSSSSASSSMGASSGRSAGCAVAALYDQYAALCRRDRMLTALPRAEFATVVGGMVDKGVLTRPSGASRHRHTASITARSPANGEKQGGANGLRVILGVAEMDVLKGIGEIGILRRFFD